jgi:hypothetical protein
MQKFTDQNCTEGEMDPQSGTEVVMDGLGPGFYWLGLWNITSQAQASKIGPGLAGLGPKPGPARVNHHARKIRLKHNILVATVVLWVNSTLIANPIHRPSRQ